MKKNYLIPFNMCLSMFIFFPVPCKRWDETYRRDMILMLPFVGLLLGIVWYGVFSILSLVSIDNFIFIKSLILSLYPILAPGLIHMDGYMDVCDSIFSYADINKKKMILKDSHVGSFAVVASIILILCNYIFMYVSILNQNSNMFLILIFIPILSRLLSSFSLINIKKMDESEYSSISIVPKITDNIYLFIIFILILLLAGISNIKYLFVLSFELIIYILCIIFCDKSYDGINGDVTGFSLIVSEAFSIFILYIIFSI